MTDDRPGEDATSEEIAAWMEDDFWDSVAEGIEAVNDENAEETENSEEEEQ